MCPTPSETCGDKLETRLSARFCHAGHTSRAVTRFLDVPNVRGNMWKQYGNKALGPFLQRWPHRTRFFFFPAVPETSGSNLVTSRLRENGIQKKLIKSVKKEEACYLDHCGSGRGNHASSLNTFFRKRARPVVPEGLLTHRWHLPWEPGQGAHRHI